MALARVPKVAALVTVFAGPRWASRKVAGERQEEADQAPQRPVNQSAPLRVTRPACVVGGLHSELTTRIRATRVTGKERRRDLGAPLRVRVVRLYEPRTHLPCQGDCSSRPERQVYTPAPRGPRVAARKRGNVDVPLISSTTRRHRVERRSRRNR